MSSSPPPLQLPPAGWYPDPEGLGLRWWDGARWTEHKQPEPPVTDTHRPRRRRVWIAAGLIAAASVGVFVLLSSGKNDLDPTLTLSSSEVESINRLFADIHESCHVADYPSTQEINRALDTEERLPGAARSVITLARQKPDALYSYDGRGRSMSDVLTDAATQLDPVVCKKSVRGSLGACSDSVSVSSTFHMCEESVSGSIGAWSPDQQKAFTLLNREARR